MQLLNEKGGDRDMPLEGEGPDGTKLLVRPRSGKVVVRRGLLKVTYWPPKLPRNQRQREELDVKFHKGHVRVECGHANFRSQEKYPDVLCGQCMYNQYVLEGRKRVKSSQVRSGRANFRCQEKYPNVLCVQCMYNR